MGDENLFLIANEELEADKKHQAVWIKALALTGGNEEKAKHQYILLRVEQIKNDQEPAGETPPSTGKMYSSIYFTSIIIGIVIAAYIYLINFDNFSEEMLMLITPLWFFPIIFGYYGFVSQRMAAKLEKSHFENVADLLFSIIQESSGTAGKLISLFVHAPFIIIKSKKPVLVALGGSIIWAVLLVVFFAFIFPTL